MATENLEMHLILARLIFLNSFFGFVYVASKFFKRLTPGRPVQEDPVPPPTPNIIYFRIHREVHIHVLHYFIHLLSFFCWVAHRELPAMDEIGLPGLDENGPGRFVVSHPARVGHSGHARVRASAHLRWCCCKRQQQMSVPHLPRRRRKNQQQCPWVGSEVERSIEALQQARKL